MKADKNSRYLMKFSSFHMKRLRVIEYYEVDRKVMLMIKKYIFRSKDQLITVIMSYKVYDESTVIE